MGTSHRWVLFAAMALVCLVAVTTALAQEQTGESSRKNSLEKGKSALMFQVVGDINLRAFDGGTISYKHNTADNRAYRVGATIDVSVDNGESKDPASGLRETNVNSQSIDVAVLKLFLSHETGRVGLYYGIGPVIGMDRSSQTSEPSGQLSYRNRSIVWSAGLDAVVGVEWFAARELSLVGEYGTSAIYRHASSKRWMRQTGGSWEIVNETTDNVWRLSPDEVRLGVSVYW